MTDYTYDALGQVASAKHYWSDGSRVAGQQFEYSFDDIGNRTQTLAGGDQNGQNLRWAGYAVNPLNQYIQINREAPLYLQMMGSARSDATVTVNDTATTRHGEYYRAEVPVANGPLYPEITHLAVLRNGSSADIVANVTGNVFVPHNPEIVLNSGYDADGNQRLDGRWTYTWDAENRLVQMVKRFPTTDLATVPHPSAQNPTAFAKVTYHYDAQGRRIARSFYTTAADTTPFVTYRYLYDGWNLLAILDSSSALLQSFVWGLDLSGSLQGAGGVGGLLMVKDTASGTMAFAAHDGNGNVMALINAANGNVVGQYEYGPFGEPIRQTGPLAKANPFRFSTKFTDNETGLLYYGYRYYNPSTGRWLGRDPIGLRGGPNLYGFVGNCPIGRADVLGLFTPQIHVQITGWAYSQIGKSSLSCRTSGRSFESLALGSVAPDSAMGFPGTTGFVYPWMSDLNNGVSLFNEEFLPSKIARGVGRVISTIEGWLVPDDIQNWWENTSIFGTAIQAGNQLDSAHFDALYQTHFGQNAWQHAMSTTGQTAPEVHQSLVNGSLALIMEYRKGSCEEGAFALGKALHYLQDSYSKSHAERVAGGIKMFQNYGLQSSHFHAEADKPSFGSYEFVNALGATSGLIRLANDMRLSEGQLRDRLANVFFQLAPNAVADDTLEYYRSRPTSLSTP